jgi:DNA-binding ferritin-like protein
MGMLDQFARDHKEHAQLLADRIRELGGTPVTGTGMAVFGNIKLERMAA